MKNILSNDNLIAAISQKSYNLSYEINLLKLINLASKTAKQVIKRANILV
jgi:hypothetical protein